jgi:nitroreductase
MDFERLVQVRRSTRQYEGRPVEKEKIEKCLEAARLAPSAHHTQPWRFIIIQDPETIQALSRKAFTGLYSATKFAFSAPVIVVLLAEIDLLTHVIAKQVQDINYSMLDMGIAGEHFILQAEDLGLGSCWIGWFDVKATRKYLKIPHSLRICSLISLGYPLKGLEHHEKRRRSRDQILLRWI